MNKSRWVISWQLHIRSYGISLHITYRTISIHGEETIKHAEWGFLRYANCCYIKSTGWRADTEEVQLESTCHKSLKVHGRANPAAALHRRALHGDDFVYAGSELQHRGSGQQEGMGWNMALPPLGAAAAIGVTEGLSALPAPHESSSHPLTLHCLDVVPRPVPKPHQIQPWCIFLEILWITFTVPVCPWVWFIAAFVRSDFCVFRAWAVLADRLPLPILWSLGL